MTATVDPDALARRRREERRRLNRGIAWQRHHRAAAQQRISGTPARTYNRLEASFARLLDEWKVDYEWQFRLGPYVYEFKLPGRILVEVQGGYWHPDPKRADLAVLTERQWQRVLRDMTRQRYAARRGYRVVPVWERDLRAGRVTPESLLGA